MVTGLTGLLSENPSYELLVYGLEAGTTNETYVMASEMDVVPNFSRFTNAAYDDSVTERGSISLSSSAVTLYLECGAETYIDTTLGQNLTATVTSTSGDSEDVVLTDAAVDGRFRGTIDAVIGTITGANGVLEATSTDTLQIECSLSARQVTQVVDNFDSFTDTTDLRTEWFGNGTFAGIDSLGNPGGDQYHAINYPMGSGLSGVAGIGHTFGTPADFCGVDPAMSVRINDTSLLTSTPQAFGPASFANYNFVLLDSEFDGVYQEVDAADFTDNVFEDLVFDNMAGTIVGGDTYECDDIAAVYVLPGVDNTTGGALDFDMDTNDFELTQLVVLSFN